ncbi:DUF4286 family protein [Marinoscillum sp.]|uniref:DUF4286 family protein n=1 Tax=Marinoscillum sp. TaxID=2024838 RepID=UPI003BAABB47
MILYNVTVNVEETVVGDWLTWMKEEHIPEVLATGCFVEHKILKLLQEDPEAQGSTYAIQYFAETMHQINHYLNNHAPLLRQKHVDRYLNKCVSFRTLLEVV